MNPPCQHPHLAQGIALLAAGVSDPESRPTLEQHLGQCPACQARYNQLLQVALEHAEEARSTPLPTPSRPFRQTLHARILATNQATTTTTATDRPAAPAHTPAVPAQPSWIPWWLAPAAVGLSVLLLAAFWPRSTPRGNPGSASAAQPQPSSPRLAIPAESLIVYRLALNESLERFDAVLNDAAQLPPPTQPIIALNAAHQLPLWE